MIQSIVYISIGASVGAVLRWTLELMLNAVSVPVPLGTLTANLLGGYCAGLAMGVFTALPGLGPELRLLMITGFLGGLTTFSTFTVQVGLLLQEQRIMSAMAAVALHVCGSLAMLFLGMRTFAALKAIFR
ncbi:MAG: fluoride efflux transporter CrcB [Desulfovibrio sp.]|nr:fluoride efflux transporter CrcB [Desulfovibrio sp.]